MQRFPVSKVISFSPISNIITKGSKVESPSALSHPEETGSEQTSLEEPAKIISQHEYIAKVHELRDGINSAWQAEDRVTSLKLSIKVNILTNQIALQQSMENLFVKISKNWLCSIPLYHFYPYE
jgi:hypothetical protein